MKNQIATLNITILAKADREMFKFDKHSVLLGLALGVLIMIFLSIAEACGEAQALKNAVTYAGFIHIGKHYVVIEEDTE